jgi:TP901 family phage tail tape measure protein
VPSLGAIYGQIRVDVSQAIAAYAAVRAANARTIYGLRGSQTAFRNAGLGMAAAGYVMVAAFSKAVGAAAEFERKMDFFGAVSNSTADQMKRVTDEVLEVSTATIYSADQIAEAVVELGKAGVAADDIADGVIKAVANLGAAADIPLDQAAQILTATMQTFNLTVEETAEVTDLLAGAANASIVEVEDLGVSLKYVGGVAASISLPVTDVIDAISLLGKAGIRGSTAGTSLRQILVSLTGTSKKASGVLKDLGIITKDGTNQFFNAKGQAKPLAEIFQILQDKTKGLTQAQRLAAFKTIFNNRALAAASILTKEGAAGFAEMNAEIGKTTAADVASKRLDNLSGDIEILKGNIETLFIKAGGPFQAFLRVAVQGLTKLVQAFSALPAPVQIGIFAFLGIGGALLILAGIFNLIISTGFAFAANLIRLKQAFIIFRAILTSVTLAVRAFTISLLTNPIFLIIAAVVALVVIFVLLYKRSEKVRNAVAAVGRFLLRVWNAVLNFFKDVPGFFSRLWDSITKVFSSAIEFIKRNWKTILVILGGPLVIAAALILKFKDKIINFFKTMGAKVISTTVSFLGKVVDFFAKLPQRVAYWIGFLIGRVLRLYFEFWKFIITKTFQGIQAVIRFFQALPGRVVAFVKLLVTAVINYYKFLWTSAINIIRALVTGVINFFKALPGRVAAFVIAMKNRAVAIFTATKNFVIRIAKAIVNGVINFVKALPGRVASLFTSTKDRAVSTLRSFLTSAKNLATSIKNGIINAITGLPGLVGNIFQKMLDAIGGFASSAFNKAKDIGSSLWNGFKDGVGINSPSYIEKAMFAISDNLNTETKKGKKSVQQLQRLGGSVVSANPARQLARSTSSSLAQLAKSQSLKTLSSIPGASAGTASKVRQPVGAPQGSRTVERTMKVTINNPAPEPASDSLYRTHQKIAYLGLEGRNN